ncbi:MAG: ATP-binding protein [Peptococcaceae bacterium]|nr:ATP-binding protein [Peptococcaceae bacterium]
MPTSTLLLSSLSIYRAITTDPTVSAWIDLMDAIDDANPKRVVLTYHQFSALAATHGWTDLLLDLILNDDNIFSRAASKGQNQVSPALKKLVIHDLALLEEAANIKPREVKELILSLFQKTGFNTHVPSDHPLHPVNWPEWEMRKEDAPVSAGAAPDAYTAAGWLVQKRQDTKTYLQENSWQTCVGILTAFYARVGCGIFGQYAAARWVTEDGHANLIGIANPDPVRMEQLIGLENEKRIIAENTEHLLAGFPANNMLLYGYRGTGKSSMVKSLLQTYVEKGLRIVEIAKRDLNDFTRLCNFLENEPGKFIMFIDDLSFDENEPEYKALKTILEGTIAARPANVAVYATSNRRHLIKETYADRTDEVFAQDVLQEKLSLSDRFGLIVTFPSPDQESFLSIIETLADQHDLQIGKKELRQMALRWEMWHNGRSGRTARQFIDNLIAAQASGNIQDMIQQETGDNA